MAFLITQVGSFDFLAYMKAMMDRFEAARDLLGRFKGESYLFGSGVLTQIGPRVASLGRSVLVVRSGFSGIEDCLATLRNSLRLAGVRIVAEIAGAKPNTPREDVLRIASELQRARPDVIVSIGGGSTIDATKAAEVFRTLGGELDDYFGVGLVTKRLAASGKALTPHVAIQTAAGSGAHLTKYANVTDIQTGQKKLIVDDAITPSRAVFDYAVTQTASPTLTADGAMDGMAHILEVFYGAVGKPHYETLRGIAEVGIPLIVEHLPIALADREPRSATAREALCLATDLGGYAIMVGGTNGGHLTSFSLVDLLSHGRACALMNPYYTMFFAPAIEGPLQVVGGMLKDAGYIRRNLKSLRGRELGMAVAEGMIAFAKAIGFPTTLAEVKGFSRTHVDRALVAAKNPQLKMKLENMPVPLTAAMIDEYMAPILNAAVTGDLSLIRNV
jgi:alcohol dehydrogenase